MLWNLNVIKMQNHLLLDSLLCNSRASGGGIVLIDILIADFMEVIVWNS